MGVIYAASALAGNLVVLYVFRGVLPLAGSKMYHWIGVNWAGTIGFDKGHSHSNFICFLSVWLENSAKESAYIEDVDQPRAPIEVVGFMVEDVE